MTDRRNVVRVANPRSETWDDPPLFDEYPMRPLTKREYERAKEDVRFARDRIKDNGGECTYDDIDEHAGPAGSEWSKPLFKKQSRKWSYNEARKLADALEGCEIARATEALCKANGISEQELRRRYNDWRNNATVREVSGITVQPDIAISYVDWVVLNADDDTLKRLHALRWGLLCGQVWATRPTSGACACATAIARSLVDQNVISGAQKDRYDRAYDALVKSFVGDFADRCPTRCSVSLSEERS